MMAAHQIDSLQDLESWLSKNQIDYKDWGTLQSKTIENLYEEIVKGECRLQDDPPIRVLSVVQLLIRQGDNVLVEVEQILCDDRIRVRASPPSEKMKLAEGWRQGALRCLEEELQINKDRVRILTDECNALIKERKSVSYPGLLSTYFIYPVVVETPSLPEGDFFTYEKSDPDADHLVNKHKWGWVPFESLDRFMERGFGREDE